MHKNFDVIIFCGLDGSGKSTQAKKLQEYLQKNNIVCHYEWFRYPNKFSLPFAGFIKLLGKSVYPISEKKKKKGIKNLENHNTLSNIWKNFLLLDFKFLNYFKIIKNLKENKNLILDRFIIDTIVDLVIISGGSLSSECLIKEFSHLIPPKTKIIFLDIDPMISFQRNHEEDVETLTKKRILYHHLIKLIGGIIINAEKPIEEVHKKILSECGLD